MMCNRSTIGILACMLVFVVRGEHRELRKHPPPKSPRTKQARCDVKEYNLQPKPLVDWLKPHEISTFTGVSESSSHFQEVMNVTLRMVSEEKRDTILNLLKVIKDVNARQPLNETMLADRENLPLAMAKSNIAGPSVEIGVRGGDFSRFLISGNPLLSMYHAVDPWAHQQADVYKDAANSDQDTQEKYCRESMVNIRSGFQDKGKAHYESYHVWRLFSDKAAPEFKDASLAFVYVDGNHDFEPVLNDLELYWPKLSPGGVLAGHDYSDGWEKGVPRAVEKFLESRPELKLHLTQKLPKAGDEGKSVVMSPELGYYVPAPYKGNKNGVRFCCPSFWIQKPLNEEQEQEGQKQV